MVAVEMTLEPPEGIVEVLPGKGDVDLQRGRRRVGRIAHDTDVEHVRRELQGKVLFIAQDALQNDIDDSPEQSIECHPR